MKYGVPLHVRSSFTGEEGTGIMDRDRSLEARTLTGLACAREQVRVELVGIPWRTGLVADLTGILAELDICADTVGHTGGARDGERGDIAFTLPEAELARARQSLEQVVANLGGGELRVSGRLAKVSLVGIGVRSDPGVAAHLCRCLLRHGISVTGLTVSELRVTCLVDEAAADRAVRALHETFGLAQGGAPPPSR